MKIMVWVSILGIVAQATMPIFAMGAKNSNHMCINTDQVSRSDEYYRLVREVFSSDNRVINQLFALGYSEREIIDLLEQHKQSSDTDCLFIGFCLGVALFGLTMAINLCVKTPWLRKLALFAVDQNESAQNRS